MLYEYGSQSAVAAERTWVRSGAHFRCRAAPLAPAAVGYPKPQVGEEFLLYIAPPPGKRLHATQYFVGSNSISLVTIVLFQARRRPPDFCDLATLQASAADASSSSSV